MAKSQGKQRVLTISRLEKGSFSDPFLGIPFMDSNIKSIAFPDPINDIAFNPNLVDLNAFLNVIREINCLRPSLNIYREVLTLDPTNSIANLALSEYFRNKKDYTKSFEHLASCLDNAKLNVDAVLQILSTYFPLILDENQYLPPFESLIKKAITNYPSHSNLFVLAGDFYFQI